MYTKNNPIHINHLYDNRKDVEKNILDDTPTLDSHGLDELEKYFFLLFYVLASRSVDKNQ